MATPYVTDETGGECGSRGAVSPRALGLGVRTWKGVCAPPIPVLLLCPAPRTAFPIHSPLQGVTCAPFWSRIWGGGLCFQSPKSWGLSVLRGQDICALSFCLAVGAPTSLGFSSFMSPFSQFPPIPASSFPSPISLSYTCFLPYYLSPTFIPFLKAVAVEDLLIAT